MTKSKTAQRHAIIMVGVADLKPHPQNYREHPDDQIEHIVKSIQDNGFYRNLVIARDNTILAGHGVFKAALKMGLSEIPVIKVDLAPDEPAALKILTGDNGIGHLAEQDDRKLSELLKTIKDYAPNGLQGTGYDEKMLANLLYVTRPKHEIEDFDAAAHWVGLPDYDAPEKPPTVIVHFRNEDDREAFMKAIEATVVNGKSGSVWSIWWPEREIEDIRSLRFEG